MEKITVLVIALIMVFALPVSAQEYDLDGEVTQKLNYLNDSETVEGLTELNLEFSKDFGFDKSIYLNPVFKLNYDENSGIDDLSLNEKLGEDSEYDFLKEAYFDYYLENTDLRVGRQIIDWGSAYELNPTDVINPRDFTAEDPTSAQLGVASIKGDYYFDYRTSLTGVVVGQHRPSPIPSVLGTMVDKKAKGMIAENVSNNIYKNLIDRGFSPEVAEQDANNYTTKIMENNFSINDPEKRGMEDLSDPEIALQFTRRNFKGYDLSVNYFKGYGDIPLITGDYSQIQKELAPIIESYILAEQDPNVDPSIETVSLDFGYKETQSIGFSGRGSLANIGVWSEINYNQNEDDEKKLDLVIGGDYTFENGFYTVAQLFHRNYKDYEINEILENNGKDKLLTNENYLILHGEMPFRSIHTFKGDIIADLEDDGYMINPAVEFSLANDYNLDIGAVVMNDESNKNDFSTLNMLAEEKAYVEFSWNF
ncbi:MAG: DUF1302 family protein [Bacillota bacterium]